MFYNATNCLSLDVSNNTLHYTTIPTLSHQPQLSCCLPHECLSVSQRVRPSSDPPQPVKCLSAPKSFPFLPSFPLTEIPPPPKPAHYSLSPSLSLSPRRFGFHASVCCTAGQPGRQAGWAWRCWSLGRARPCWRHSVLTIERFGRLPTLAHCCCADVVNVTNVNVNAAAPARALSVPDTPTVILLSSPSPARDKEPWLSWVQGLGEALPLPSCSAVPCFERK